MTLLEQRKQCTSGYHANCPGPNDRQSITLSNCIPFNSEDCGSVDQVEEEGVPVVSVPICH